MADSLGVFLALWKQLSDHDKQKSLAAFAKQPQIRATREGEPEVSAKSLAKSENPRKVYSSVQLYSYYSYLYYYPIMHWTLDKTPDTDNYWVGIYMKGAPNDQYIAYQWVKKAAQGSYKIGRLNTTAGQESRDRSEEFELRIFKGSYQRFDAETNVLRGRIINAPADPSSSSATRLVADIRSRQLDAETHDFVHAIEMALASEVETGKPSSVEHLRTQWNKFTPLQQQLLFPILEQDSLPDEITKPGAKALDRPEPKVCFPTLGRRTEPADDEVAAPRKIVLTITLDHSFTYIYPVVDVHQVIPSKWAWMGVYYTQSDVSYDPDKRIDDDWQWVGNGRGSFKLNYIEEHQQRRSNKQYVGAIFDWNGSSYVQIGMAGLTIQAAVSATPALPPAIFKPDFDKDEALRYANLSQLAYEPYSVVQQRLPDYKLEAEMQIFNSKTNTNGFIASDDKAVVVAFRGTEISSWQNLLTDAWFAQEHIAIDEHGFPVSGHKGFICALNTVYSSIEAKLKPLLGKKQLFITGHSLGGALATLLVYRISSAYKCQPTQYVYGCPPVGNIILATYFKGKYSNTITIQNDPVSSGTLIALGEWVNFYKPHQVKYLPATGGHGIANYVQQLEKL